MPAGQERRLWITLLSMGFLLAALLSNGRQLVQLRPDPQGWLWLLLGVGVSLLSYAGGVRLGIATDAGLVPDPEQLIAGFEQELADYHRLARLPESPPPVGARRR